MGACELKRQAKLEQWKTQVIDCRSSGMSVRDGVRNTIFRQRRTTAGKGNPFIGSHRTCARSFSTAATGSLL